MLRTSHTSSLSWRRRRWISLACDPSIKRRSVDHQASCLKGTPPMPAVPLVPGPGTPHVLLTAREPAAGALLVRRPPMEEVLVPSGEALGCHRAPLGEPVGSVQEVAGTSRALRYGCGPPESGRASGRWGPCCTTLTPAPCVRIMKAVGRSGACLAHPGKGGRVGSTGLRSARSSTRQSRSASHHMRPRASLRAGFCRQRLWTSTGAFSKP